MRPIWGTAVPTIYRENCKGYNTFEEADPLLSLHFLAKSDHIFNKAYETVGSYKGIRKIITKLFGTLQQHHSTGDILLFGCLFTTLFFGNFRIFL